MQTVALHWHVYLLTRSPLALGAIGLVRVLPVIVFSLWAGVVADRADRRRVMLRAQTAMMAVALVLSLATFTGGESLPFLYVMTALSAAAGAFDNPARQALLPRLVPLEDLPGALTLNLTMFHAATIAGPALSGLLIAGAAHLTPTATPSGIQGTGGLAGIYLLNAVSFLFVIVALLKMRTSGETRAPQDAPDSEAQRPAAVPAMESLRQGLRFVFSTPILVWTMGLDFVATFFSGAMSLLPIFADSILRVGPHGYGLLAAAPAVGALLGSLATSLRPLPPRQGPLLLASVAAYGATTMVFGLSRSFPLTLFALALSGLADFVSTVIRQALRQLVTPDGLRGRMTSVTMIFFMGGPQLGELEAGLVASLFASAALGATVSVVSGGAATILAAIWVAFASPVVRRYDLREHVMGESTSR